MHVMAWHCSAEARSRAGLAALESGVLGLGLRVAGLRFTVQDLGFRI